MKNQILYLDYQSTTPVLPEVRLTMNSTPFANPNSREHLLGEQAYECFNQTKSSVAKILNVHDSEIIFTSGATEASNFMAFGILASIATQGRNKVLVSPFEHACILEPLKELERKSIIKIQFLPHTRGIHNSEDILKAVDERTIAVIVMSVNNEIGSINNLSEIYTDLKSLNILTIVDHSQAPGKISLTNPQGNHLCCDIGIFSGHKMYGPKGIGLIYIAKNLHPYIKPILFGGSQQQNLRPGTIPLELVVGFAEALRISTTCWQKWHQEIVNIRDYILESIEKSGIKFELNGPDLNKRVPHNLNIRFVNIPSEILLVNASFIALSTGSACSNIGGQKYSNVLKSLNLTQDSILESIRFGLSHLIDQDELKSSLQKFIEILRKLQNL